MQMAGEVDQSADRMDIWTAAADLPTNWRLTILVPARLGGHAYWWLQLLVALSATEKDSTFAGNLAGKKLANLKPGRMGKQAMQMAITTSQVEGGWEQAVVAIYRPIFCKASQPPAVGWRRANNAPTFLQGSLH